MILPTHLVAAQTAYIAACIGLGRVPDPIEAAVAMGATAVMDIDNPDSYTGRIIPHLAEWLQAEIGHRSLTHSALLILTACAVVWALAPQYLVAVAAGMGSHALLDMMTCKGVQFFWPSRVRCVLPGNRQYRFEIRHYGELSVAIAIGILGIAFMPIAMMGERPIDLVRDAIGSLHAARHRYDAEKGDWAWSLEVRGRDNRSHADISGVYPVIGPNLMQGGGFIIAAPEPVTVCTDAGTCDWYAESARLVRGQAQHTTSITIERRSLSAAALFTVLSALPFEAEIYLLGTATALGIEAQPPTVAVSGERVTMQYMPLSTLRVWAQEGRILHDTRVTVQIRHALGTIVPPLDLPDDTQPEAIPNILRGWIN